jgi:hypothetical protein
VNGEVFTHEFATSKEAFKAVLALMMPPLMCRQVSVSCEGWPKVLKINRTKRTP